MSVITSEHYFGSNILKSLTDTPDLIKAKEDKVKKVMDEWKSGKLKTPAGKTVTDRKQAIAIALSEAGLSKAGYTDSELDELIGEHKQLVKVLKSPQHSDDVKEAKKQENELKEYEKDIK